MRFGAFILAIMVLVLSSVPCTDDVFAMNTGKANTEIRTTPIHQHNSTDACSPFCQCACCAGFTFNHVFYPLTIPTSFISSPYMDYRSVDIVEISLPIWQPPQL